MLLAGVREIERAWRCLSLDELSLHTTSLFELWGRVSLSRRCTALHTHPMQHCNSGTVVDCNMYIEHTTLVHRCMHKRLRH